MTDPEHDDALDSAADAPNQGRSTEEPAEGADDAPGGGEGSPDA